MPIQYVDGHPTIAVDVANDRLKVNDATLEQKVNDLNTKIDAIISGDSPATTLTQLSGSTVTSAVAITPNDTADLTNPAIGIYAGGAGDLKVDLVGSGTVTMKNIVAGTWHPIAVKRVYATGTTATAILGAW